MPLIEHNLAVHPDAGAVIHRQIEAICRRVEVHAARPARGEVVRRQAAARRATAPVEINRAVVADERRLPGRTDGSKVFSPPAGHDDDRRRRSRRWHRCGPGCRRRRRGNGLWASQSVAAGTASAEAAVQWAVRSARAAPRSQWPSRWASGFLWQAAQRSCETAPRPAGAPSRRWPRPVQSEHVPGPAIRVGEAGRKLAEVRYDGRGHLRVVAFSAPGASSRMNTVSPGRQSRPTATIASPARLPPARSPGWAGLPTPACPRRRLSACARRPVQGETTKQAGRSADHCGHHRNDRAEWPGPAPA